MKPLPHQDATTLRQSLPQIRSLVQERSWSAAYETLGVFGATIEQWSQTPEYGEWCLLRSQAAVELGHYREAVDIGRKAFASFQLTADNARIGLAQRVIHTLTQGLFEVFSVDVDADVGWLLEEDGAKLPKPAAEIEQWPLKRDLC